MVSAEQVRAIVAEVRDPEIPVLSIADLGILRDVEVAADRVVITITPTYSGCPAMDMIRSDIGERLHESGIEEAEIRTVLAPAWSTDWMTDEARRKLAEYGIAPPGPAAEEPLSVGCPRCGSGNVKELSRFGATACQAQYACQSCLEPFDHFKAH